MKVWVFCSAGYAFSGGESYKPEGERDGLFCPA